MIMRTLSLSTILGFLGLMLMIHAFNTHAANTTITCSTAFGEKIFRISDKKVTFEKPDSYEIKRSISSVSSPHIRTHIKNKGFSKTLYLNGLKHRIRIKNSKQFSELDDYLSITSPKGHEMTYPLNCHSV